MVLVGPGCLVKNGPGWGKHTQLKLVTVHRQKLESDDDCCLRESERVSVALCFLHLPCYLTRCRPLIWAGVGNLCSHPFIEAQHALQKTQSPVYLNPGDPQLKGGLHIAHQQQSGLICYIPAYRLESHALRQTTRDHFNA